MTGSAGGEDVALPDAFISHSSRDKQSFVRPLVESLAEYGARVWYDEYSMSAGDSLSATIDRGLVAARAGVVVISPAFIETARQSGWTHYELRGIVSNSLGTYGKRIVPVWLDVTLDDVQAWSPPLADLLAIDASGKTIEAVALEVMQVIAPDRAGGLARLRALFSAQRDARRGEVRLKDVNLLPAPDRRVPGHVPLRALLVTQVLEGAADSASTDLGAFLESLARDLHHERELRLWEAIAGSFSVACGTHNLEGAKRRALFELLLMASLGRAHRSSIELLTPQVAGQVLEHFQTLQQIARGEVVIGEGGLKGLVRGADDAEGQSVASDLDSN